MIAEMDRLEIVCLREALPEVVAFLQSRGAMHMEEVPLTLDDTPGFLHRIHLSEEQQLELAALEQLDTTLAALVPLLTKQPTPDEAVRAGAALADLPSGKWRSMTRSWSRELRSLTRRRANIEDNLATLREFRHALHTVATLVDAQEAVLGRNAEIFVLHEDAPRALGRIEERLRAELKGRAALRHTRLHQRAHLGVITYGERDGGTIATLLHEEHVAPLQLPDKGLRDRPIVHALSGMGTSVAVQEASLSEVRETLMAFSEEKAPQVAGLRAAVADRLGQLRVLRRFAHTRLVAVIHGWVPRIDRPAFEEAVTKRFGNRIAVESLPVARVDRHSIPTQLRNQPLFRPFEVLLSLMQPPAYGGIDPSPMVGFFFVFFYGFMLGDVVYGIAVGLLAFWLRRRFAQHAVVRAASTVGFYMSGSAILFGVLFGEYCGDLGAELFGIHPVWFHRGENLTALLWGAVFIGSIHVLLSLVLGMVESLRRHARGHAVEQAGYVLGLLGLGAGVLGYLHAGPLSSVASYSLAGLLEATCVILIVAAAGAMAPIRIMEVITLAANVLSYTRLMALGVASLALADVANELARETGSIALGILVAAPLHLLNLVIGMFSPTIHSLRLNYVESLPKFYVPEGRMYKPFKKEAI